MSKPALALVAVAILAAVSAQLGSWGPVMGQTAPVPAATTAVPSPAGAEQSGSGGGEYGPVAQAATATVTPQPSATAVSAAAAPAAGGQAVEVPAAGRAAAQPVEPPLAPGQGLDFEIPDGWWFTQTNSRAPGVTSLGFPITDTGGVRMWDGFQRLGGVAALGYPASAPFTGGFPSAGPFVYQVMQGALLQWWPDRGEALLANIFQIMEEAGLDDVLYARYQIPRPIKQDGARSFEEAVLVRLSWMEEPVIKGKFLANPNPEAIPQWTLDDALRLYGLPMSMPERFGPFVVQRFQRIAFQHWVETVPGGPPAGTVVRVLGGDMLKQFGLVPGEAARPRALTNE